MGKNKFCQPENQFPQAETATHEFKSFNKTLNKEILFPFPLAGMKNSLRKRFHLTEKLFSQPGISDKQKKTLFQQPEKQLLLGAKKFFIKNWPTRFDNGFH